MHLPTGGQISSCALAVCDATAVTGQILSPLSCLTKKGLMIVDASGSKFFYSKAVMCRSCSIGDVLDTLLCSTRRLLAVALFSAQAAQGHGAYG